MKRKSLLKKLQELRQKVAEVEEELRREREVSYLQTRVNLRQLELNDLREERQDRANEPIELSIISPGKGDEWQKKKVVKISWIYSGLIGEHLRVDLLKNGHLFREINLRHLLNSQELSWVVPNELPAAEDYQIRLISRETGVEEISDCFKIVG